ncbi:MAG: MBL fold metallo-hydrolase [Acidimicrobiales bacterium]
MMEVITLETPALGDRSYVVHDGSVGFVVDPQRDIDRITAITDELGIAVTHVLETHVHNDYVSGGLALARRCGASLVHAAGEGLSFDHMAVAAGDVLTVGSLRVEVVATPGHTPHHLTYVVRDGSAPPAVFTGGSLLHGSVGRTDLIGDEATDRLTRAQYRSVRALAGTLPDEARIHPTHGFGSFCTSGGSGDGSDGTLGTERRVNSALSVADEDEFVAQLLDGLGAYPAYYAHMDPLNRAGLGPLDLAPPTTVDPVELGRRIHRGEWVVDLRPRRAFADHHVAGTIGIELADAFVTYVGWLIPWGMPLTLLADDATDITAAARQLAHIGIDRPAGAATGGPADWAPDANRRSYPVLRFEDLAGTEGQILDVRRNEEHATSHLAGAVNVPIHELTDRIDELDGTRHLVHCASGYRAAIAASLLDRAGRDVALIDDDFARAADAGLPMAGDRPGH